MIDQLLPLMTAAAIVVATVAGIRRTWAAVDGWRAVVAVVVVALALCTALAAYAAPALWYQGAIQGVIVAVLALGGDSYLTRLASKAGTTRRVEVVDTSATPEIIPPAPPTPKIEVRP